VRGNESSDKCGTDAFEIDFMFTHGQIAVQIFFVDAPKRAQEITCARPQAFNSVGMDLPDAIAIIIPCPFLLAVTYRVVIPLDAVVALPLICITGGVFLGVAVHVFLQRLSIGMLAHAQPALATFSTDGSHHGRAIILIGAVPSSLVRAAARWIAWVAVFVAFFPPRSETSHRFLSRRPATPGSLTLYIRWLGAVCATDAHIDAKARVLPLTPSPVRLYKSRGLATPHSVALDCCPQRACLYRGYRSVDSGDSGNRQSRACVAETHALLALTLHSLGTVNLGGENVSLPTRDFPARPKARL
jgi:hypothetical protein